MQTRHTQPSTISRGLTPNPTPSTAPAQPAEQQSEKPRQRPAERSADRAAEKATAKPGEKPVDFSFKGAQAKTVQVAGTFNNWDPKRTPMRKDGNGGWKVTISLPPGRYEYRFVADGQWITDSSANEQVSNPYGGTNAVLVV